MHKILKFIVLSFSILFLLSGCSSVQELSKDAFKQAGKTFDKKAEKATEKIGDVSFYLPGGFAIEEKKDDTNIVFNQNQQLFVLFVNKQEKSDSKLLYELAKKEASKKLLAEKTFKKDKSFGYVTIFEAEDKQVEIVVGIGGIKLTTITSKKDIETDVVTMMQIVRSVKLEEVKK